MRTEAGKKHVKESKEAARRKHKSDEVDSPAKGGKGKGNWKRKMKQALKTDQGLKTIMSILAEEEKNNTALVAALQSQPSDNVQGLVSLGTTSLIDDIGFDSLTSILLFMGLSLMSGLIMFDLLLQQVAN